MITLVIVDCQNDFITGTMRVKNSHNAIDSIKGFIKKHKEEISNIVFTIDWHPYDHCSFKRNGGEWPVHCVQYTPGACIEPKLLKYIQSTNIKYQVCPKGELSYAEQYGAFEDIECVDDYLGKRYYFDSIIKVEGDTDLVVCGIAGDYCVKETIKNLLYKNIVPKVFMPGIVSTDGGKIFSDFVKDSKLEKIV